MAAIRVAVTGGAGFIGAHLVRELLARPEVSEVRVVDDLSTGSTANLAGAAGPDGSGPVLHEGSVLDAALLDAAFGGADAVVHLAAAPSVPRSVVDPPASHHAHATGALEVLQAARRAGGLHVVVASSSAVYGTGRPLPEREELRPEPSSPYAVGKLAAEGYARAFHACYGLPVLPFRLFNVFGPLQPANRADAAVVPSFVSAALAGLPLTVRGDGRQTRDFTYVGTVVRVLADAVVGRVVHPEPVNLAFGSRTSLLELIALLCGVVDVRVEYAHAEPRAGDVRDSQADGARLRRLFPQVRPVPLHEGLERTVAWFRGGPM